MTTKDNMNRYFKATHAMQSGVAAEMNYRTQPTEPKHLRVGINSALVDSSSLARLLMSKGVFTEEEYTAAIADGMEAEVERYRIHISKLLGKDVTLE